MKQKFNELLDKPWTTRGYLKFTGIVYVICMIFVGVWWLKFYWDEVKDWFKKKFKKKETKKRRLIRLEMRGLEKSRPFVLFLFSQKIHIL